MTSIVADTHAIIWYIVEPNRLSSSALEAFEQATNARDFIYFSDISLVELCYLVERGRLPKVVLEQLLNALDDEETSIYSIPVNRAIATTLQTINRVTVPDMPDRIIAATALHLQLPLITRDHRIRALTVPQTIW